MICSTPFPRLPARRVTRFVVVIGLFLAACGGPAPRPPPALTYPGGPQCLAMLVQYGAAFSTTGDIGQSGGCGIATPIALAGLGAQLSRPATLGCPLALALSHYERMVLQPEAMRLLGQPVVTVHHVGAYACRGRSGNAGRLSEHAHGRAIDITAFELLDGTMIRVRDGWHGRGPETEFLRRVGRDACEVFNVVLGPSHDSAHADHLHLDIGPWRLCDP